MKGAEEVREQARIRLDRHWLGWPLTQRAIPADTITVVALVIAGQEIPEGRLEITSLHEN